MARTKSIPRSLDKNRRELKKISNSLVNNGLNSGIKDMWRNVKSRWLKT